MTGQSHFLEPLTRDRSGPWSLVLADTRDVLVRTLLPAFDSPARNRGLLGRQGLSPGTALVLAPCSAVHTFFMRFPLDLLFVARSGSVVKASTHVRPWRLAGAFGAFAVIECPAGSTAKFGGLVGRRVELTAEKMVRDRNKADLG